MAEQRASIGFYDRYMLAGAKAAACEEYGLPMNKSYQQGTFDEEWAKVLAWRQEYQQILESETE